MSLMKQEGLVTALDDYEQLRVTDIRAVGPGGVEIDMRDERSGLDYTIASHADYWDFLGYFEWGKPWPIKRYRVAELP